MASVVLDTSALLAFVHGEPGGQMVARLIGDAAMSAVNFAEAVTKLVNRGASLDQAKHVLSFAEVDIIDFDRRQAEATGALVSRTRSQSLSLGDRACLTLAMELGLPAVTADPSWKSLGVNVTVQVIR